MLLELIGKLIGKSDLTYFAICPSMIFLKYPILEKYWCVLGRKVLGVCKRISDNILKFIQSYSNHLIAILFH